jgi:hypothetical protein
MEELEPVKLKNRGFTYSQFILRRERNQLATIHGEAN